MTRYWKEIKGYENKYKISNYGEVVSLPRFKNNHSKLQEVPMKQIKPYINKKNGYVYVYLCNNGKYKNCRLHKLVAQTFIPNPNCYNQINHIDSNRKNNDVSNLEFCTHKQNTQWALKTGRFDNMKKLNSERMKGNKLNGYIYANEITKKKIIQCDLDDNFIKEYQSISEASRQTGITITGISYCANGIRKSGGGYLWHFI